MGNSDWIIGLAVLAAGGWCFLAGPCKGWLGQLTNGSGGGVIDNTRLNQLNAAARDPEFTSIINDTIKGNISDSEKNSRIQTLAKKYKSNYTYPSYRY